MTIYAFKFEGNLVVQTICYEGVDITLPEEYTEVDETTWHQVKAGYTKNLDGTFSAPSLPRKLRKYDFFSLLTPTEYGAMFNQTDPTLAYGVALFQSAPDPFNIDDPVVTQMLNYCVQVNALTQARKDELWASMQAAAI